MSNHSFICNYSSVKVLMLFECNKKHAVLLCCGFLHGWRGLFGNTKCAKHRDLAVGWCCASVVRSVDSLLLDPEIDPKLGGQGKPKTYTSPSSESLEAYHFTSDSAPLRFWSI